MSLVMRAGERGERAATADPGLEAARATMAEIFDGPPEFVDLNVVNDVVVESRQSRGRG
jgi:hypothetical protein